jgi:hypothetical protein
MMATTLPFKCIISLNRLFMKKLATKLYRLLESKILFFVVIGFFIFEALWFVFSAVYPMAFDENVHFGLIQLYAHHLSPFLNGQPADANQFGAVARDPSYLYHYLMSFPYRLITLFTHDETIQVIILRLINVAMFTAGLLFFSKVMAKAKASQGLINVSFAIFVLIPIVPQLAAQINYDNMVMLLLPLFCLVSFSVIENMRQRRIDARALLIFMTLSLIISLVKYSTLPFIAAASIFFTVVLCMSFHKHYHKLWPAVRHGFGSVSRLVLVLLIGSILLTSVLFVQRYGDNLKLYKTPLPSCNQVLTIKQCSQYGPAQRDYNYTEHKSTSFRPEVFSFMVSWLQGMWYRLFFAINGSASGFNNSPGLPLPTQSAVILAVSGLIAMLYYGRRILSHNMLLAFLMLITIFYLVALWLDNYTEYSQTGVAVAINGRYLLPILPFVAVAMGRAFSLALRRRPQIKVLLAVLAILLFLNGGGVFNFILSSNSSWYWPSPVVNSTNNAARKVLSHIMLKDDGVKENT